MKYISPLPSFVPRCGLALAAGVLLLLIAGPPAAAVTCEASPAVIDIGLGYHGAPLTVSGESGSAEDIVIRIMSPLEENHLKYKDKAAGLFWMKKGTMTFKSVPGAYLLFSTADPSAILSREEREKHLVGYEALEGQVEIDSDKADLDAGTWFGEYVTFKEKEHLYAVRNGAISRDGGTYRLETDWPFEASPGDYQVEVLAVSRGRVTDRSECTLTVARKGAVAWLSKLAFERAPLYGIMAIVIAMASGLAVGAVFKGGGGH